MALSETQKASITEAARLAPSADNSVPWQYSWQPDGSLLLVNDKNRSGKATDSTYILTNLAIGAAAENADLKAQSFGCSCSTVYQKNGSDIAVTLHFSPLNDDDIDENTLNIELVNQIELRHSDRRFPFKGELTKELIDELKASINNSKHSLTVFNDKAEIKKVVPNIRRAEAVRFKSESLHSELFETVKFDDHAPDEGMTLDVLGIEPPARPIFRLLNKWSWMNRLNKIGAAQMIAVRSVTLPIVNSPGLALITTPSDKAEHIFNAGRQIQRVWLQATALGLSVHLYAAPGVLTLAKPDLAPSLASELLKIEDQLDHITPGTEKAVMFLRLGFKQGLPARTSRRTLESLRRKVS